LEGYDTREGRYDPYFVTAKMSLTEYLQGQEPVTRDIQFHECTEEDWEQFNKPL